MTSDEAQEILAAARNTLHRIRDVRVEHHYHEDDAMTRWRSGMPPRPAPAPPLTVADVDSRIAANMANVDDRIAAAFEARAWKHQGSMEAVSMALAETRKKMRGEFQEQLRAKTVERDQDRGEVIDLPALPTRSARRG